MRPVRFVVLLLLMATVAMSAGCSEGRRGPKTVQVAGTLYLDGKPLEGAEIRFFSSDFVSVAVSGSGGKYELVQGGVPGENRVTVRKIEGDGIKLDPDAGYDLGQLEAQMEAVAQASGRSGKRGDVPGLKQLVPDHYGDPSKTKLTYTVPEGGTDSADFRLTTK
jgi:hypothetical protein